MFSRDQRNRLAEQRRKQQEAEELMRNKALNEAFDGIRAAYVEAIVQSKPSQTEDRERLYQAIQILDGVRVHLKATVADGKKAESDLHRVTKYEKGARNGR